MNKVIPSLLIGAVLGAAGAWLALSHGAAPAPEAPAPKIDISTDRAAIARQLAAAGLAYATPTPVTVTPEVKGYGHVLDPSPLIGLEAEIEADQAAADASSRELARLERLHAENDNASVQAVETARAAARRDDVQLAAARSRLLAGWGGALAQTADLPSLIHAVAAGDAALVRIDLLSGDAPPRMPATAQVSPLTGSAPPAEVALLGPAPAADPQSQGVGYLAVWRDHPLPPGTALRAALATSGEAEKGLELPRSAFVRHDGGVFVYVQTAAGGFERRLVTLGRALPDGIVVATGLEAGDKVVVTGAGQLLATEILGSTGGGDED